MNLTLLFLPGGPTEIILVMLLLVVLFGPKKIPKLARSVGESIGQFEIGKQKAEKEVKKITEDDESDDEESEAVDSDTEKNN